MSLDHDPPVNLPQANDPNLEAYQPKPLTLVQHSLLLERRRWAARSLPLHSPGGVVPLTLSLTEVPITYDVEQGIWRLLDDCTLDYQGCTLLAKKGFTFDLSSVPRILWWLIAPNELSILAPLFHDLLYEFRGQLPDDQVTPYRTFTRRETDLLFLQLMESEGVANWRRMAAYSAVRAAGSLFWWTD